MPILIVSAPKFLQRPAPQPGAPLFGAPRPERPSAPANPDYRPLPAGIRRRGTGPAGHRIGPPGPTRLGGFGGAGPPGRPAAVAITLAAHRDGPCLRPPIELSSPLFRSRAVGQGPPSRRGARGVRRPKSFEARDARGPFEIPEAPILGNQSVVGHANSQHWQQPQSDAPHYVWH